MVKAVLAGDICTCTARSGMSIAASGLLTGWLSLKHVFCLRHLKLGVYPLFRDLGQSGGGFWHNWYRDKAPTENLGPWAEQDHLIRT
jgi:hypothetical protein